MIRLAILFVLTSAAWAPVVGASTSGDCADVTEPLVSGTYGPDDPVGTGPYVWLPGGGAEVWLETNGFPGLQLVACHGDGVTHPADTRAAGASLPAPGDLFCLWWLRICIL